MRKVSFCTVAVMALVGLPGFGGEARAQNEPLVLENVIGWWDHLDCEKMINAVNAIAGLDTEHPVLENGGSPEEFTPGTDGDNDSEREWCYTFAALGTNQQRAVTAGAKQSRADGGITTAATDRVFDMHGWWDGLTDEGRLIAIGEAAATAPAATVDAATVSVAGRIRAAYDVLLSGMPAEEAPAVPLVGLGVLGALLAGRGVYLRRRTAA